MDFNVVLEQVGDFGRYQKLLCIFLVIPSALFSSLVYFTQFFIIAIPLHRCHIPGHNASSLNWNFLSEEDKCLMPNVSRHSTLGLNDSSGNLPCQHGWDYDFSELYPTISTDLNWVCDDAQLPYIAQTIFYIGTSVGVLVFGYIADKYGRKPSILLSYSLVVIGGVGTAFVSDFYSFAFLRFLVGSSIIPLSEDPYILSLEYMGVSQRTIPIVFWSASYIIMSAICPWLAYFIHDWKMLSLATSAPLAVVLLAGILIPESASWLLTKGKHEETVRILQQVARINKTQVPKEVLDLLTKEEQSSKKEAPKDDTSILDLFRSPRMRKHLLLLALAWLVTYNCYHVNTQNASNLGTNFYDSFTYSALIEVPALMVILFGLDTLGRKWPMLGATLVAALSGLLAYLWPSVPHLVISLAQRVAFTLEYNILFQYSAEVFPTAIRGRAVGFLRFTGTLGLYLSPFIVYLALTDPGLPLVVSGLLAAAICLSSLFLPETLNRQLPHTLEEGEAFGKDQPLLYCPSCGTLDANVDISTATQKTVEVVVEERL